MTFIRISPISFSLKPADSEIRDDWHVIKKYHDEGNGPHLVDLSHCPKWDLQNRDIATFTPAGISIPEKPGETLFRDGCIVNRMNATQASIWLLNARQSDRRAESLSDNVYTDTTDSLALIAIVGRNLIRITETLTSMDLHNPHVIPPRLFQGPVLQIPSQVVRLGIHDDMEAFLIGFARGYGQSMADAMLKAGRPYGLAPGGEDIFTHWLSDLQ